MAKYRTAPDTTDRMPSGISFIIGNEAAERFSFYGMKAILAVFMTKYLIDATGHPDPMSQADATTWIHFFTFAVYITPILGALLSDSLLGKYRTIILLSLVYCAGHLALAMDSTRTGLLIGLGLIAFGAGGIKPCVSAHVGDQFGKNNHHLLSKVFSWFYFAINLGAFASMIATPRLLKNFGPEWAFAVPGVLMAIATVVFWAGRKRFAHIPPGGKRFLTESFSGEGMRCMGKLAIIYAFVAMFWALFDQTASRWVFQAEEMNRMVYGFEILPSEMQSFNPLLVMIIIPLFSYGLYPWLNRFFDLTPLRKMAIGFFLATMAFIIPMWIESQIQMGLAPSIAWQALAYILMTAAEVLISITCLEFSYTQAPRAMKSFIMSLFLASVAIGNLFTAIINKVGATELTGVSYYGFFTACIGITAVLFLLVVKFYKEKTHIHDDQARDEPVNE